MPAEIKRDPDLEWLDHVQPVGLVVAPLVLKELGLPPKRQTQIDSAQVAEHIEADEGKPALRDPWGFVRDALGWEARHVAGSPGGPNLFPTDLHFRLPEHDTTLAPTWAVKELGRAEQPWQLLVRIEPAGTDPDARGALDGWEATAHQRFERLLRETAVFAGLLITDKELRLVYAPSGETSGWLSFPIRALATVAGRPMLGGLKLLLDSFRLFTDADDRRLPALLKKSREAQAAVSTALAEQVLGALHELLRGLDAADAAISSASSRDAGPQHLYEGLLTVLMRLVFILYAEDRDLLPSRTDGARAKLYETGYSRARPLRQAHRRCRAQSRHHGRAPRRLGPAARAVPPDPQGPRVASSRRAAASCSIRTSSRSSKAAARAGRSAARPAGLRRLHPAHPRRPDDACT